MARALLLDLRPAREPAAAADGAAGPAVDVPSGMAAFVVPLPAPGEEGPAAMVDLDSAALRARSSAEGGARKEARNGARMAELVGDDQFLGLVMAGGTRRPSPRAASGRERGS